MFPAVEVHPYPLKHNTLVRECVATPSVRFRAIEALHVYLVIALVTRTNKRHNSCVVNLLYDRAPLRRRTSPKIYHHSCRI